MKCQHCGINFDDSERECPMCGARAGSRGRLGEAQQRVRAQRAEPVQQSHAAYIKAKARPTGRKAKASAKPIRENKKRGRGKIAAIVIAVAVVINIVPLLTDLADNFAESVSTYRFDSEAGGWQEDLRYVPGETYPYDPDNYQPVYAALYDLTGGYAAGVLSDGSTIAISVEEGEMGDYTLTVQDGTGIYTENGYTWCSYNYPEEAVYDEDYPPYQYDCFTLSLSAEGYSYEGRSSIPERYALDEYGERWFFLYYAPETGEVVLEDMDESGLFGADESVSFAALEQG